MKVLTSTGLTELITKIKTWATNSFLSSSNTQQTTELNIDSTPTANSTNLITSGGVKLAIDGKKNLPSIVNSGTNITLADNTEYVLTDVTNLTLIAPDGNFECLLDITFSSSTPSITFPTASKYIGRQPTFSASERWEISIKNNIIVAGKVLN